jgi:hypothetical protein
MLTHFFYDITHFDSKFFDSLKLLVTRPGLLSEEYMRGRRHSYLNPVKMYVFTSAVFFLVFFSLYSVDEQSLRFSGVEDDFLVKLRSEKAKLLQSAGSKEDSLRIVNFYQVLESDTTDKQKAKTGNAGWLNFTFDSSLQKFKTVSAYDSAQLLLPASERDGWFIRMISRKTVSLLAKYDGRGATLGSLILNKFIHTFPYILFVSLPLYALFLKLLYIRNKKFYFADHGIFLVHVYIFTFILMLIYFGADELSGMQGLKWLNWLQAALLIYGVVYVFKAMRNFYRQGFGKTLVKFSVFNLLCIISISILFVLFLIVTFFKV